MSLEIQERIAEATRARGYRDGWTTDQFAARQVAKLMEELGELTEWFKMSSSEYDDPADRIIKLGFILGEYFDDEAEWGNAGIFYGMLEEVKSELADIAVVLFNLADAVGELDGKPFDVVAAALEKATSDIERGVR